jgi:hypothetical protein
MVVAADGLEPLDSDSDSDPDAYEQRLALGVGIAIGIVLGAAGIRNREPPVVNCFIRVNPRNQRSKNEFILR